jgi:PEP-CTERM motif
MRIKSALLVAVAAVAIPLSTVSAATLFNETFDTDHSADWTFASSISGDTANNNSGGEANAFFDYSTVGIPSAPGSGGTTRGMKMESNVPGTAVFSGMSMSHNTFAIPSGDFNMTFNAWQNANGPFPAGGSGSTQMTFGGFGGAPGVVQFPGGTTQNSIYFGGTGEGGSGVDYRAYLGNGGFTGTPPVQTVAAGSTMPDTQKNPDGTPVYAAGAVAGSTNNSNAYYASLGSNTAPAAQTALFPQQTGATALGTLGMTWRNWQIQRIGTKTTWSVDGKLIATVDSTMNPGFSYSGSDIFFGQFDINATSSTDTNARNLLFGLVDNVVVTDEVPEPASLALLTLGGVAVLGRRRRHA